MKSELATKIESSLERILETPLTTLTEKITQPLQF